MRRPRPPRGCQAIGRKRTRQNKTIRAALQLHLTEDYHWNWGETPRDTCVGVCPQRLKNASKKPYCEYLSYCTDVHKTSNRTLDILPHSLLWQSFLSHCQTLFIHTRYHFLDHCFSAGINLQNQYDFTSYGEQRWAKQTKEEDSEWVKQKRRPRGAAPY